MSVPQGDPLALMKERINGYQASKNWAIDHLAAALGIDADKGKALEFYVTKIIEALRRTED